MKSGFTKDEQNIFIIAEAGDQHFGSVKLAKEMALNAKLCNASAIKFQHHLPDEEFICEHPGGDYEFEYIAMLAAFKIFLEAVDVVPYHVVGGFFFVVVILVLFINLHRTMNQKETTQKTRPVPLLVGNDAFFDQGSGEKAEETLVFFAFLVHLL